jgi:hypothetical protein
LLPLSPLPGDDVSFEPCGKCEEREWVLNRREDMPASASSQDIRCRQVDGSEKVLNYGDYAPRHPAVLFVVPLQF